MIHRCKIQCHSIDKTISELTGEPDPGKWLPFVFNMDLIAAAKLSSDEEDSISFGCTTLFCNSGETYVIDTSFRVFMNKFIKYSKWVDGEIDEEETPTDNLDL